MLPDQHHQVMWLLEHGVLMLEVGSIYLAIKLSIITTTGSCNVLFLIVFEVTILNSDLKDTNYTTTSN